MRAPASFNQCDRYAGSSQASRYDAAGGPRANNDIVELAAIHAHVEAESYTGARQVDAEKPAI